MLPTHLNGEGMIECYTMYLAYLMHNVKSEKKHHCCLSSFRLELQQCHDDTKSCSLKAVVWKYLLESITELMNYCHDILVEILG